MLMTNRDVKHRRYHCSLQSTCEASCVQNTPLLSSQCRYKSSYGNAVEGRGYGQINYVPTKNPEVEEEVAIHQEAVADHQEAVAGHHQKEVAGRALQQP